MKLTDLTENQRRTLRALNELKTASRHEIVERSQQSAKLISAMLNRLEAMGLVEKPETHGSGWTISPSGRALFSDKLPAEYPAQPMIKEPPTQTLETPDVKIDSNHNDVAVVTESAEPLVIETPLNNSPSIANEILTAMEIEIALEQLRARMNTQKIPAQSARVYREITMALPAVLQTALAPITQWVEQLGG